jgi:ApaG protein
MMNIIDITSSIKYLEEQSNPSIPFFMFSYNIEIKNKSNDSVQLLNRHWEIIDGNGTTNIVNGKGVVGLQPLISKNKKFSYSSFCPLSTEFGMMNGWYEMKTDSGMVFKTQIPTINLFTPTSKN